MKRCLPRVLSVALALLAVSGLGAPASSSATPYFFLQLTDPQFGMFTDNADFAQETANFEFAIATANRLRPAFVIVTGDLVNKPGDAAQISEYKRIAGKLDPAIPLHNVAGNHDVGNVPTPESIAAYERQFGSDHYVFTTTSLTGIVLDSSLIHSPQGAPDLAAAQLAWLKTALAQASRDTTRRIVVFQHHSWFLAQADEPDQYFNIPRERRSVYLALFHQSGVKGLFAGHYHRNAAGRDGEIEMVTSGPVGKPLGGAKSGLRIVTVGEAIASRYYEFGDLPNRVE
jgi:3',5'-cyclic AMP phosphodiesterase CpdA